MADIGRRVSSAEIHGVLDLRSLGLKVFPRAAVGECGRDLTELTECNLSKNKLTRIPEELAEYTELEKLNCYNNRIVDVQDLSTTLTLLTHLNLGRNDICDLPEGLCHLPLVVLDVSGNRLERLPTSIGQVATLVELDASDNHITELPSVGNLARLTKLNLCRNELSTLPRDIGKLQELVTLNVAMNKLTKLPLALRQLERNLENFDVDDNPNLVQPPLEICQRGMAHMFHWFKEQAKVMHLSKFGDGNDDEERERSFTADLPDDDDMNTDGADHGAVDVHIPAASDPDAHRFSAPRYEPAADYDDGDGMAMAMEESPPPPHHREDIGADNLLKQLAAVDARLSQVSGASRDDGPTPTIDPELVGNPFVVDESDPDAELAKLRAELQAVRHVSHSLERVLEEEMAVEIQEANNMEIQEANNGYVVCGDDDTDTADDDVVALSAAVIPHHDGPHGMEEALSSPEQHRVAAGGGGDGEDADMELVRLEQEYAQQVSEDMAQALAEEEQHRLMLEQQQRVKDEAAARQRAHEAEQHGRERRRIEHAEAAAQTQREEQARAAQEAALEAALAASDNERARRNKETVVEAHGATSTTSQHSAAGHGASTSTNTTSSHAHPYASTQHRPGMLVVLSGMESHTGMEKYGPLETGDVGRIVSVGNDGVQVETTAGVTYWYGPETITATSTVDTAVTSAFANLDRTRQLQATYSEAEAKREAERAAMEAPTYQLGATAGLRSTTHHHHHTAPSSSASTPTHQDPLHHPQPTLRSAPQPHASNAVPTRSTALPAHTILGESDTVSAKPPPPPPASLKPHLEATSPPAPAPEPEPEPPQPPQPASLVVAPSPSAPPPSASAGTKGVKQRPSILNSFRGKALPKPRVSASTSSTPGSTPTTPGMAVPRFSREKDLNTTNNTTATTNNTNNTVAAASGGTLATHDVSHDATAQQQDPVAASSSHAVPPSTTTTAKMSPAQARAHAAVKPAPPPKSPATVRAAAALHHHQQHSQPAGSVLACSGAHHTETTQAYVPTHRDGDDDDGHGGHPTVGSGLSSHPHSTEAGSAPTPPHPQPHPRSHPHPHPHPSSHHWKETMAPYVIDLVLSKPEDTVRVQFAARLTPRLAQPDCLVTVLTLILQSLDGQPPLTVDILEGDTSGALTKVLLFQRLSPLLLLRMLPTDVSLLTDTPDVGEALSALRDMLLSRLSAECEFDDVRKVAAELTSRSPPNMVLPVLVTALGTQVKQLATVHLNHDPGIAKAIVYALCCTIALHRGKVLQHPPSTLIVGLCVDIFRLDPARSAGHSEASVDHTEGLIKLQRGCMDLLGLMVAVETLGTVAEQPEVSSGHGSHHATPKIVELADDDATGQDAVQPTGTGGSGGSRHAPGTDTLGGLLSLLTSPTDGPVPICVANAIIATDRHIQQLCNDEADRSSAAYGALLSRCASVLMDLVAGSVKDTSVRTRAAAAQVLFTLTFRLQNHAHMDRYRDDLIDVAIAVLNEPTALPKAPLRLGAVKLLGAVLGRAVSVAVSNESKLETPVDMPGRGLARVHSVLVGLANLDTDPQVQTIAADLLRALGVPSSA
eukprot:m.76112 g.76112  ORF g.76112 m.76112 type:complete len:1569 (-) comp9038_c0_seq3:8-4714(-)